MVIKAGYLIRQFGQRLQPGLVRHLGRPVCVLFHGVEPHTDDARVQRNHHETAAFREIAKSLKENFQVLPLSALDDVLKRPERHGRSVFLMADDGYANNLTITADILAEFGLPWTLFVSTHHIDSAQPNPIFLARLFFHYAPASRYTIPHLPPAFELGARAGREAIAALAIARLKTLSAPCAGEAVAAMRRALEPHGLAGLLARFASERFLSWPQIAALKQRGVEIGAHAHVHWPMHGAQSGAYLQEQARLPRARIEAEIGPCRYFAYPFGNKSDICRDAWHAVRDAGYDYAFTTLSGSLDASTNRYLLPRYGLQSREPRLASLLPLLRAGNPRLVDWQKQIAD